MRSLPHIAVCICTFKRPGLLPELFRELARQRTDGRFTYEIVIADNDGARSAEQTVREYASVSPLRVTYCVEPEVNIARARNRSVAHASGDFVAFIDDDEVPASDWLYTLFETRERHGVDGVLGPVIARFQQPPPQWVKRGKFFDRPRHETGRTVKWTEARTGNVLLRKQVLDELDPPFRVEFATGGEDVDFFRRSMENGHSFVWCHDAAVFELVPPHRCTRRFLLRRALLRGSNFPKLRAHGVRNGLKSLIAVPCYTVALPILALVGHHLFIAYLIKLLDHASRLLALAGLPVSNQRQS